MNNAGLDKQVAEAQGYIQIDNLHWHDVNGTWIVDGTPYEPSTDKAQAMELMIKYKIHVMWMPNGRCQAFDSKLVMYDHINDTESDTPMQAICLAVVKLLEGDG